MDGRAITCCHLQLYNHLNPFYWCVFDNKSLYSRFMSSICEEIKVIILRTLPNLSEDIVQLVISTLKSSGVESKADLKYVEQDEIKDLLPVIQQRKLLEAFKMETTTVVLDLHPLPDDLVHQKSAGGSLSLFSSPLPCSSSSSLAGFSPLSSSLPASAPPEIADVERTLTLPTSPRLILLAENHNAQSTLPVDEDGELTLRIIQLLMAYFDERRDALILLADMSATAADVERTLTLPTSPRLILLGKCLMECRT
ncbi:uncharacterized protein LOC133639909 [Entelurus aequoreus]|uniref:uncharacterized protein LOC133639909 n=1 Tax=Entelurus aequoreus TaxID=161455 RepID=UPI002B1D59E4|nr:uncharacterized protein LOC133639909 [Entelurus aequoreus]